MSPSATPPNSRNSRRRTPEAGAGPVRLPTSLVRACCRKCAQFDFPRGQHLYYEGHDSYGLFVVGAGVVELEREQGAGRVKDEVGPGALLGAKELLTGSPHRATAVVASDHAKVCFIDKTAFLSMVSTQQPLGQLILKAVLRP